MKLLTSLLVTGIASIIVTGCTFAQPTSVPATPSKIAEAAPALAVIPSPSPAASDLDKTKFTSTPTLLRPTASASRESRPTLTSTPIASPTVTAHVTLTLTLKLNKDTYNLKEPVTATLRLTNSGNKSVLIHKLQTWGSQWYPIGATVYVWLFDPNGDPFGPPGYIDLVRPTLSDYDTLDPNESIEATRNLRWDYELAHPGAYSIQVLYQNEVDPKSGEASWKGEAWSNAVIFTVKP